MKIYVVGYEAKDKGAISFWDWYETEVSAMNRKVELETNLELKGIIYHGIVEVPFDETDITSYIENYLCENDWENAFK